MPDEELTRLLSRIKAGDRAAENRLVEILCADFKVIAAQRMSRERPDHTWAPSDLVNETLIRLFGDGTLALATDREFVLCAASKAMRQLLVDHHRRRSADKRWGRLRKHPLDAALDQLGSVNGIDRVDLDDELRVLEGVNSRACLVLQLRAFLMMSTEDVASRLGISQRSVDRDFCFARAWLHDRLYPSEAQ